MPTSKPEPQQPQPTRREIRVERINCPVPETPIPAPARAQDADAQAVEEQALTGAFTQASERIRALWECIWKHNERAEKASK